MTGGKSDELYLQVESTCDGFKLKRIMLLTWFIELGFLEASWAYDLRSCVFSEILGKTDDDVGFLGGIEDFY